ncbi:putative leucine-rich repeat receptor-like serine/threonine-protein kinase At2g04300 isoform X2 [Typha angustifolia]|uniref:putative leucine-rich repeat receptor-like serine/threonine-protein kinase At2g04300 isoform X2 n=1 Tax=Typha angustifolia TaxID=59011 RepID=UPI003C2E920E
MGPKEDSDLIIRYPDDPYDRYWIPWNKVLSRPPGLTEISTTSPIRHLPVDHYDAPSAVIQTALTPKNASKIEYHWTSDAQGKDPGFLIVLYFSEFQTVQGDAKREFDIYLNGIQWADPFSPDYLYSDALFNDKPAPRYPRYNLSIVATSKSTLPPIINALELFRVLDITGNGTDRGDVSAMIAIKETYQLKKSWNGDPCAPRAFAWDGLNCSYAISTPPRITTVNLSSSGLTGGISISFGSLAALQYLDLSHNNLTGSIPDVLAQLSSLVFLDLTDNQLNGSIPAGLLKKSQDGLLTLRIGENLCANDSSCMPPSGETDSMNPSIVIVPVVVLLFLIVILTIYIMRKRKACHQQDTSLKLEIRRFRYKELEVITKNFTQQIGKGGFGKVYGGFLEDGTQVAVKLHSQSSKQGVKEFVTEAKYLARVHHKYLLSMIGYCNNGGHLGLVYEYMSGGTLESHLRGACSTSPLTWKQRLHIALESAEGLEYLHNGCKPQIIHRDIKTSNILLDQNLGAKIADFGMSKDIGIESSVNAAPRVVGTKGYLDPEYCITGIVTEKSDVYSFGVVLLEMITGQPPILDQSEVAHITQWVNQRLNRGTIDNVIDIAMKGNYNPDCVWNVAELAFECTKRAPSQRPTMTVVVMQLQECLELENFVERNHHMPSGSRNPHSRIDEPNRD